MPRDKVRMEYNYASILLSSSPKMYTSLIFIYEYMIIVKWDIPKMIEALVIGDCH